MFTSKYPHKHAIEQIFKDFFKKHLFSARVVLKVKAGLWAASPNHPKALFFPKNAPLRPLAAQKDGHSSSSGGWGRLPVFILVYGVFMAGGSVGLVGCGGFQIAGAPLSE